MDLIDLFDHVWDRFWRRMDGLSDVEWRWLPTHGSVCAGGWDTSVACSARTAT
jgi:hypothetical protein